MADVFFTTLHDEALVVKSLLESAGIEAGIAGEYQVDVIPLYASPEGGVKVFVPEEQAEDALAVIADFKARRSAPPPP
jgi:hypothetical protein